MRGMESYDPRRMRIEHLWDEAAEHLGRVEKLEGIADEDALLTMTLDYFRCFDIQMNTRELL